MGSTVFPIKNKINWIYRYGDSGIVDLSQKLVDCIQVFKDNSDYVLHFSFLWLRILWNWILFRRN